MRQLLPALVVLGAVLAVAGSVHALHECDFQGETFNCGGDPPNRQPHANAGPDRTVAESEIVTLSANVSFDPDGDELEYQWTLISFSDPDLLPLQMCTLECDLDDGQLAFYGPYMEPGQKTRLTMVWELQVFDRDQGAVEAICQPTQTQPCTKEEVAQEENHYDVDEVTITVVNTNQPPHGWFLANEVREWYRLAPNTMYEEEQGTPSTVDPEETDYIHFIPGTDSVDIVRPPFGGDYVPQIPFDVVAWDDKGIVTVEVYLYKSDGIDAWEKKTDRTFDCESDAVPHQVRFGLGRQTVLPEGTVMDPGAAPFFNQAYRGQTNPTAERGEIWSGTLSVDHPKLVAADYRLCARAWDVDGANTTTSQDIDFLTVLESFESDQSPPCLAMVVAHENGTVSGAIKPDVPEKPTYNPVDEFSCTQPPTPPDDTCSAYEPQVLGPGEIIRIDARILPFGLPGEEQYEPDTAYLLEKVTLQHNLTEPGQTPLVLTREVELQSPYVISLDSLAPGTQRIHVRAYDRAGGVSEICIPVTADIGPPQVLVRHEDPYFLAVPGTFRVYLHDQVDAQTVLEIKRYVAGTTFREKLETKPLSDILGATPVGGPYPDEWLDDPARSGMRVVRLPALQTFPVLDVNRDGVMDVVYDHAVASRPDLAADPNYQFKWDRYFSFVDERIHILASIDCDADKVRDHVEDLDGNKKCDPGEPFVKAQGRKDPDLNAERIAYSSANLAGAQPTGPLVGFLLQRPTWVFVFDVTPTQQGTFDYIVMTSDVATNSFIRTGSFSVERYQADIRAVDIRQGEGAPFLPGDVVVLEADFVHETPLVGTTARLPVYYTFALQDPFAGFPGGVNDPNITARFFEMLADGSLQQLMCADPSGGTEPVGCLLAPGEMGSAEHEFRLRPGAHTLFASARAAPAVNESDSSDNSLNRTIEVYLGRTIVDDELVFHIRADASGLPRLSEGVINLDGNETYTMSLDLAGESYEWTVDGVTYYWDPDERRDPATPKKLCEAEGASGAFPEACRPITLYKERPAAPEDEESPGAGVLLLGSALMGLAALARRRRP